MRKTASEQLSQSEIVPTGIVGLDDVLRGGLFRGGVYIVEGAPGSGKTTLGNHVAFNWARSGERVVYITLVSESHDRMLQYLGPMSFVDASLLPDSMSYISAFPALRDEGLSGALSLVRDAVRQKSPSLVVLDGLYVAQERAPTQKDFRDFIYGVQGEANLHNCTVIFLTSSSNPSFSPERTMADGLICLTDELLQARAVRRLHVIKFRGAAVLRGRHGMRITDDGIVVTPRLEAMFRWSDEAPAGPRLSSGPSGLDRMTNGGVEAYSTTLILGPSGVGKTSFGLSFLAQSTAERPGLMFGCYETPERIKEKARSIGIDIDTLIAAKALTIVWHRPFESFLDEMSFRLFEAVRQHRPQRLFIDGIGAFRQTAIHPERLNAFFSSLSLSLRQKGVTTYCSAEMIGMLDPRILTIDELSPIADNAILLRYAEYRSRLLRFMSILKLRACAFDAAIVPFEITGKGIEIGAQLENVEAILRGTVHTVPPDTHS